MAGMVAANETRHLKELQRLLESMFGVRHDARSAVGLQLPQLRHFLQCESALLRGWMCLAV